MLLGPIPAAVRPFRNRSSELRFCDGLAGVAKSLSFLRASVGALWALCLEVLLGPIPAAVRPFRNRSSELRFCDGLAGVAKALCFLRASVGDVRHFGRRAWRCCWARFLLLFGRFGTAPQSSGSAMGWLVWQNLFVFLGLQ